MSALVPAGTPSYPLTVPTKKRRTFLDANVLFGAFRGERKYHSKAVAIMREAREFVANDILELEIIPRAVFLRNQKELEFFRFYLSSVVTHLETSPADVKAALALACQYGLGAADSIHLKSALDTQCDELITAEKPTSELLKANGHHGITVTTIYVR